MHETKAIMYYLAAKYGYMPDDPMEAWMDDMLYMWMYDRLGKIVGPMT